MKKYVAAILFCMGCASSPGLEPVKIRLENIEERVDTVAKDQRTIRLAQEAERGLEGRPVVRTNFPKLKPLKEVEEVEGLFENLEFTEALGAIIGTALVFLFGWKRKTVVSLVRIGLGAVKRIFKSGGKNEKS